MAVQTIYELSAVSYSVSLSFSPNGQSSWFARYALSGFPISRNSPLFFRSGSGRLLRRGVAPGRDMLAFGRSFDRMGPPSRHCGRTCSHRTERARGIRGQVVGLEAGISSGLSKLVIRQSCLCGHAARDRASRAALSRGFRASRNWALFGRRESLCAYPGGGAGATAQLDKKARSHLVRRGSR